MNTEKARRCLAFFYADDKNSAFVNNFSIPQMQRMRQGENVGLKWSALDFKTGELHISRQVCRVSDKSVVSTPKTGSSIRAIILSPDIPDVLAAYHRHVICGRMLPSPVNEVEPRNPNSICSRFYCFSEAFSREYLPGRIPVSFLNISEK